MENQNSKLLSEVASYYSDKLAVHGRSAKGVDWNGDESQILRFEQLSRIIRGDGCFSITDIGCGYGAYLEYLAPLFDDFTYCGLDISDEMIAAARVSFSKNSRASFLVGSTPIEVSDFCVASGIFNVRLQNNEKTWSAYLNSTLDVLNKWSTKGFAFNCLTSYSDEDKMRDYLHYADPCEIFDTCMQKYSRNVAILHDYDLYEFTVLVRKSI